MTSHSLYLLGLFFPSTDVQPHCHNIFLGTFFINVKTLRREIGISNSVLYPLCLVSWCLHISPLYMNYPLRSTLSKWARNILLLEPTPSFSSILYWKFNSLATTLKEPILLLNHVFGEQLDSPWQNTRASLMKFQMLLDWDYPCSHSNFLFLVGLLPFEGDSTC